MMISLLENSRLKLQLGLVFFDADIRSIIAHGKLLVLKINVINFVIVDNEANESENLYEMIFAKYSDLKFVSTRTRNRDASNYYKSFELRLNSQIENILGGITMQAGFNGKKTILMYIELIFIMFPRALKSLLA